MSVAKVSPEPAAMIAETWVEDQASTISTASLKAFLPLHARPINPVVFRGSLVIRHALLIFQEASRLDAFSGYPCLT